MAMAIRLEFAVVVVWDSKQLLATEHNEGQHSNFFLLLLKFLGCCKNGNLILYAAEKFYDFFPINSFIASMHTTSNTLGVCRGMFCRNFENCFLREL